MLKKEKKSKMIFYVSIETFLMIGMIFAVSHFWKEAINYVPDEITIQQEKKSNIIPYLWKLVGRLIFNENNFVSALENSDLENGAYTCLRDKEGNICQEYSASECDEKCSSECLPAGKEYVSSCQIGMCYDDSQGTCQIGSPRQACEQESGKWFPDQYGNIPECRKGCCVLGDNAYLGTAKQCDKDSLILGLKKDFRSDVGTEIACLSLAKTQEEGACVFEHESENTCKFSTKANCLQNLKGKFYSGYLCSSPELKTNCKKQAVAKCAEGKDEIYFFDSCGNRENIYDANKIKSYNNGKILAKADSCSLVSGTALLDNQKTCGNCNYFLGTKCSPATQSEKLADSTIGFVCKDLSCTDEYGKTRQHGESWCSYQGAIGLDKENNRGSDTIGSRNYRKICYDGSVRIDACADYRNEICIESQSINQNGKKFSSAACRINLAYTCYEYNNVGESPKEKLTPSEAAARQKQVADKCEKNPDCFVKKVNIDEGFSFDICVPKYKPGFDLQTRSSGAEAICSIASQTCKAIYVKDFDAVASTFGSPTARWVCKANCDCLKKEFTEKMNDLCMSLGDCGAQVNYIGSLSESYNIKKAPKLNSAYLSGIKKYADRSLYKGQFIEAGNITALYDILGIPPGLGITGSLEDSLSQLQVANYISGAVGLIITSFPSLVGAYSLTSALPYTWAAAPTIGAVGGALAGAAVGFAMTSFLLQITGVAGGLSPIIVYSIIAMGTVAGALIGLALVASVSAVVPIVGWVIALVVVIFIVILTVLGVGDTKEVLVKFACQPWQPPVGGKDCSKCGKDGLPCSKYACQSLGQTCEYINEESGNPECIAISPDDTAPPVITPIKQVLPEGYKAEELDYGVKILSPENDGCIKETYTAIPFGISLNEPSQCKFSSVHKDSFEEMDDSLSSGLFLKNHSLPLSIPSLESLGAESFDPHAKLDFNLYLRCQDKNGNKNIREYNINLCIKQGPDTTPPMIVEKKPLIDSISFSAASVNASIFTNEPSECKWSTRDSDYNLMTNNFICENSIADRKLQGWECSASLPINANNNTFYVRCLDQPWLASNESSAGNESARNPNKESFVLNFRRTSNDLKIDSVNVDNKNLVFAKEPVTVEIIAKTSGGLDGNARCSYIYGSNKVDFTETWKKEHKLVFNQLFSGKIDLPIICEDAAGNVAERSVSFEIKIDSQPPQVSRAYSQNNAINIVTDEPSQCYYSFDVTEECLFDITNATQMSGSALLHSAEFDQNQVYYIKCYDEFKNYNGGCSIILRGSKV